MASARRVGEFSAAAPYVIDLDYWVRLLLEGDAQYQAESLVSFRVSTGSWSVAIGKRQSADFHRLMHNIAARPDFKTRRADLLAGKAMARLNSYLRIVLYRLVLARGREP
jgi:hypothetical protein